MNQDSSHGPLISTSALAKKLDLPTRSVFELLVEKGWIERVGKHWKLTGKGQFEGGDYVNSKKYGEFIGWPEAVAEHNIFAQLFDRPLRTRVIGKELGIAAHRFNALLAELGWQHRHHRGWVLTPAGRAQAGRDAEDEESGVPYTLWPRTILDDSRLANALHALELPLAHLRRSLAAQEESAAGKDKGAAAGNESAAGKGNSPQQSLDLPFDGDEEAGAALRAMDGHCLQHPEDTALDNWFYLMGVAHAYQRSLPDERLGHCDFYLPAARLYIECWHAGDKGKALKEKMTRLEYYKSQQLSHHELTASDLVKLDAVLPRLLLKHGITVF